MELFYDHDADNEVFDVPFAPTASNQLDTGKRQRFQFDTFSKVKSSEDNSHFAGSSQLNALSNSYPSKTQYHSLVLKFVLELAIDIPFVQESDIEDVKDICVGGQSMEVSRGRWNGQTIAVKRLRSDRLLGWTDRSNHTKKAKFRRIIKDMIYEVRAMSHKSLHNHRNIVTLLGVGLDDIYINSAGTTSQLSLESFSPFLLLPWAISDLDSYWLKGGHFIPEEAAGIVSDIADGLEALHRHDLVHSDLKPGNVLLFHESSDAKKLVAKLTDFGGIASKQYYRDPESWTHKWAAPECYLDPHQAPEEYEFGCGPIRDIFSFGLVAMHVALQGESHGCSLQSVDDRRDHFGKELADLYRKKWPCHGSLLKKWLELLRNTVIANPHDRILAMNPDKLGMVRKFLLDNDPFEVSKTQFYGQVIPFPGRRGWRDTHRHWHRFASKPATGRTSIAIRKLPVAIKRQICKDYENFDAWTLRFSRDYRYIRAGARMAVIALSCAVDRNCLPIKIDHKAFLLTSSVAPGSQSLGFFNTYLRFLLIPVFWIMPNLGKLIIDRTPLGESLDIHDDHIRRALWNAVEKGHKHIVMEMVGRDPSLLRTTHAGRKLIHYATSLNQIEIVKFLLQRDPASLQSKTELEHTPLHVAAGCQATECVSYMLDSDAKLDAKNVYGYTPVQHAQILYLWSLVIPTLKSDRCHRIIRLLRARNPRREDILSRPALLKIASDWVMICIHFGLCLVASILILAVALGCCYKSFVKGGILQVLLDCMVIAIRFGRAWVRPVENFLGLPSRAIFDVIYTSVLVPHNLWLNMFLDLLCLEFDRLTLHLDASIEDLAWLHWAAGRSELFNYKNQDHWKAVANIVCWGILKPDSDKFRAFIN